MNETRWDDVDSYVTHLLSPPDDVLENADSATADAGLPMIAVSPAQGAMLSILATAVRARRILEVGTLGGYSAIWLARALAADGRLVSLEIDQHHAEVARRNLDAAGLADRVDIRVGPAADTLAALAAEGAGPFDLTFIDADKASNVDYFRWAVLLSRPGSLVVVDNVVRGGDVVKADSDDAAVIGTRRMFEAMAAEPRVQATVVQTVGAKGYDGFAIAVVTK